MHKISDFVSAEELAVFDYTQEEKRLAREEEELQRMWMNRKQRRAYASQQRKASKK